jgi:penicillin amidase
MRLMRAALRVAGLVPAVALLAIGGLCLRWRLLASLPQQDGERRVAGIQAPVRIGRDRWGVPAIRAENRLDAAYGLGFVHGQERFFQMDLERRLAAGELAELLGPKVLEFDKEYRMDRFRQVARQVVERGGPEQRAFLEAYTAGVNAGLSALGARPPEYLILFAEPRPWQPEDSVLCLLAMFIELQSDPAARQSRLGAMRDALPPELFAFLAPRGTEWDAPMLGRAETQPPVPGPQVCDLRKLPGQPRSAALEEQPPAFPGSNNWAVAGSRTADGRAILANDMHLAITVPSAWFYASLEWPGADGMQRVTGVTLPGTGAVAAGSNGHVAWGFTNSYGEWRDLVVLEQPEGDPDAYRTPDGPKRLEHLQETLHVKGGKDQQLEILQSVWGPVVDTDARGRRRALRWVAHDPEAVNFRSLGLETARTVAEAQSVANRSGIPAQNFVCADAQGHIGWTIMGIIPRRVGCDGLPASWADGSRRWDGWLEPERYPRIVDPPGGQVWTANNRVVDGPMLDLLGDGGYDLGARARQIRDDLAALAKPTEQDLLRVQLDDRALFLERWRGLLLDLLTPEALRQDPRRVEFRRLVQAWSGRADVDSVGYRLVRGFRLLFGRQVSSSFAAAYRQSEDPRFRPGLFAQAEGPLWALATQRPPHLLDSKFKTWDESLLTAVDQVIEQLTAKHTALADHPWGQLNSPKVQHPLAKAVPALGRWLDMPTLPIPGDSDMPRVQEREFGASERLVVSPGHEDDGIFMMPCGESGHPASPHYGDGHRDWAAGRPRAFLPGPAVATLVLRPLDMNHKE